MDIIIKDLDQDTVEKIENIVAEKNAKKVEPLLGIVENLNKDIADAYTKFTREWDKLTKKKKIEDILYNQAMGK